VAPVGPVRPVMPMGPVAPVAPVGPVRPVIPIGPVAPVGPVRPVMPMGPVAPVGPVGPAISEGQQFWGGQGGQQGIGMRQQKPCSSRQSQLFAGSRQEEPRQEELRPGFRFAPPYCEQLMVFVL